MSFFTERRSLSPLFFNSPATTEIYTLSLHDALPISQALAIASFRPSSLWTTGCASGRTRTCDPLLRRQPLYPAELRDRKSTRLNSSHLVISYAVFCLKKKKKTKKNKKTTYLHIYNTI